MHNDLAIRAVACLGLAFFKINAEPRPGITSKVMHMLFLLSAVYSFSAVLIR